MAASRPLPGPFTRTSTCRSPCSMARRAAVSGARPAAYGVLFREPLKPTVPAEAHESTAPFGSVNVMIVLLNVDAMNAFPTGTFFRSLRRVFCFRSAMLTCFPYGLSGALLLGDGLAPTGNGAARAPLGAGVCPRTLTASRKPAAVTDPAITVDLNQALDVLAYLLPQLAFHREVLVDDFANAPHLIVREVTHLGIGRYVHLGTDLERRRPADAIDVAQGDFDLLFTRNVNTRDTGHVSLPTPAAACAA